MKKKRSISSKITRSILLIAAIPIIVLWIAIIALYLPPLQRYAVDLVCNKVSNSSGYDIRIGSLHLALPLKLNIDNFSMSRNDTLFIKGESADVHISLMPLLKGEVELNYISLENIDLDTRDMIAGVAIQGNIGFFRSVARNIYLQQEIADIRQIHLHSTDLNITLTYEDKEEDEEDSTLNWIARLYKGTIENCNIRLSIPKENIDAKVHIGKLSLKEGVFDIGNSLYQAAKLQLDNSRARYDKPGSESPLDHIKANGIRLDCSDLEISPEFAEIEINDLTLTQPKGVEITETAASIFADHNSLEVKRLSLRSRNGSFITANISLPWNALKSKEKAEMIADLNIKLNKRDLGAVITDEQYESLSLFQDDMFSSNLKFNGNVSLMNIDTLHIDAPSLLTMGASGRATDITDKKKIAATLDINGIVKEIRGLIENIKDSTAIGFNEGKFDGTVLYSSGIADADLNIEAAGGTATAKANYDINTGRYDADIAVNNLEINRILPDLPLNKLSMNVVAEGEGLNLFDKRTTYTAHITIDTIQYAETSLGNIVMDANQTDGLSNIEITADDSNLMFYLNATTTLDSADIRNKTLLNVSRADFGKLNLIEGNISTEMQVEIELDTDLDEVHAIKLSGKKIRRVTPHKTFTPENVYIDFATAPDSSFIDAKNGDLVVRGTMSSGYNGLFKSLDKVGRMFVNALQNNDLTHYIQEYEKELPYISVGLNCGRNNMLANYLATNGIVTNSLSIDVNMDSISGINLRSGVYGLQSGELNLDTIRVFVGQEKNRIRYFAGLRSSALSPDKIKESYSAALFGLLAGDTLSTDFLFRDKNDEPAVKLGAITKIKSDGIEVTFNPEAILLGETFNFNRGNFLNIGKDLSAEADVMFSSDNGSGMHLYTTPDEDSKYNANLELWGVNLKSLTSIIPYSPDIAGILNLDTHFKLDGNGMLLSSDINAEDVIYDGVYIGNEIIEAVYFPKDGNTHYIDLLLLHNENEVAHMAGNYKDADSTSGLDGKITLKQFPLELSKAFLQDGGVTLGGFLNGEMNANGELSALNTNGYIQFESVNIDAYSFGTNLHMADETLKIEDNKMLFNDFNVYAQGSNPFKINGTIDFTHLANPAFDLRMSANSYELINSERKKGSMFYGKLFVDTKAIIGGTLNNMKFYGDVAMLGKSNITYVMLDAPIESDKELDGIVEFVNFNDTTTFVSKENGINLGNINLNLSLRIEDGARINADLNEGRSNYVTTQGNGNLHITYTGEAGLNVTGRYNMDGGEFKLTLPVIPLKTLQISEGSNISWSGPILDPKLNITALERVTSSVTLEDNNLVPVPFDVGVEVSNTLNNMGLSFVMLSPENPTIQDHLNTLDTETMNRYAVTMLITGAYAGSSKSMTVSNALNSFIDAKINDIAGAAMKSVSVNVGINDATNAETGSTYKNYSFSFSKRFWNDRITFVIGGEVSSGDHPTSNNSFINNASLEWKLSEKSNRFLKLFYDKNYESILEGEITEMGIGYVYKRKLNCLKELFIFNSRKRKNDTGATMATEEENEAYGHKEEKEEKL